MHDCRQGFIRRRTNLQCSQRYAFEVYFCDFWPTLYDICAHIFIDRTHLVRPWLVVCCLRKTCQHFLLHSHNNMNAFLNFSSFFFFNVYLRNEEWRFIHFSAEKCEREYFYFLKKYPNTAKNIELFSKKKPFFLNDYTKKKSYA